MKPFLWATPAGLAQLQKKYLGLSREFHPDRANQSDADAMEAAESRTALLNLDYAKLKDFWKLVDAVIADDLDPSACPVRANKTAPPELTAEYFDLQERASDEGRDAPGVRQAFAELDAKITALLRAQETQVQQSAQRFPYAGFGAAEIRPWQQDDLLELKGLLEQVRYSRSFLRDLKTKFAFAS